MFIIFSGIVVYDDMAVLSYDQHLVCIMGLAVYGVIEEVYYSRNFINTNENICICIHYITFSTAVTVTQYNLFFNNI